jgi:hypothetical protein
VAPGLTTRDGNEFGLADRIAGSEMKRFSAIAKLATTPLLPDRRQTGSICVTPEKQRQFNRSMQHHLSYELFYQVVFMASGKRTRLSAMQRADVWRRIPDPCE